MTKPYDLADLGAKLKAQGLDVAEEALKVLITCTFDWAAESAILSPNKVDDILGALLPIAKSHVLSLADKVDGQVG